MDAIAPARLKLQPLNGHGTPPPIVSDKPVVVILPGSIVTQELPQIVQSKSANGMNKGIAHLLEKGGCQKVPDIFCTVYSHIDESIYLREHAPKGVLHPGYGGRTPDAKQFVEDVLFARMGLSDGTRPDVATACRRLSQVTLVAHSYGTVFAQEVCAAFRDELEKRGYAPQEVGRLCHEVILVSLANGARVKREEAGFRTYNFGAEVDLTVYNVMRRVGENYLAKHGKQSFDPLKNYEAAGYDPTLLQQRLAKPANYIHPPRARELPRKMRTPHGMCIISDLPDELVIQDPKRGQVTLNRDSLNNMLSQIAALEGSKGLDGQPLVRPEIVMVHHVPMFISRGKGNTLLVRMVENALTNAVQREPALPGKLYANPEAVLREPRGQSAA